MNNKQKHYWIYVLELKEGKYYVGLTSQHNAAGRLRQHKTGFFSAQWVKKHGYKDTMQVHDLGLTTFEEAELVETRLAFDMMKQYGVDNVRGGRANYSGKYYARFGGLYREDDWRGLVACTILLLVIVWLTIDKYLVGQ